VKRLIRLYPRAWRERYHDVFHDLLASLSAEGPSRWRRTRLGVDIVRGAVDAHRQRLAAGARAVDPGLRRGLLDGLLLAVVVATLLVLSNVVFPAGPDESDNDPEYLVQIYSAYVVLAGLFVLVGRRARRRSDAEWSGAVGGAAAGFVMAVGVMVVSLVIDNAFLAIVSQQHDKRVAFEASGASSMRAYLNLRTLLGAVVVIPAATFLAGLLGLVGGTLPRRQPGR
jgi:hypothetical protein